MLGHVIFFHHTMRKMVVSFGSLFKDVYIERHAKHDVNVDNEPQKYILVPLSYGPKQKWLHRIRQNPVLESGNVALIIPRMAFLLDSVVYDADRKLQSTVYNQKVVSDESKNMQYVPVPYDYNFLLYILTDNAEDGTQILEQILPFFTPEFTVTVNTVPDVGIAHDVPVILNSVTHEDNFDTEFDQKRLIIWTLQFTMKGWVYGPIREQGIIRRVIEDIHVVTGGVSTTITDEQVAKTPRHVRITVDPDPIDASPDDEFGYKTTIEEFNDNKKRNPVTGQDEEIL